MDSSLQDEFLAAALLATGFVHTVISPVEDARTCAGIYICARANTYKCTHGRTGEHAHVNAQNNVPETPISIHSSTHLPVHASLVYGVRQVSHRQCHERPRQERRNVRNNRKILCSHDAECDPRRRQSRKRAHVAF